MLEDRQYMRRPSFGHRRSATIALIVLNILLFIAQNILENRWPQLHAYLALSVDGLRHGYLWQLLSFQFLHSTIGHLLFNCFAIFMFGRSVEEAVGQKPFLALYFCSGVIGGLFQSLSNIIFGQAASVVGASAGAFGLTAAYAVLFPDSVILLLFILPVPARFFLIIGAIIAGLGITPATEHLVVPLTGPNVAHAAHLGGLITGILFVRYAVHWRLSWPRMQRPGRSPVRRLVKVHSQKPSGWGIDRSHPEEELPAEEFVSKEVDPILDKITAHGIHSLTERERRILEKARSKIGKR
jgi:membrane associated rhomboid family serine protease